MLISFRVGNFLSFDEPVTFSLEAGRKTTRHEGHIVEVNGVSVLRGAIVYGANASGKSNLLKAMDIFQQVLHSGDCSLLRGMQFALGKSIRPDILFDVVFANNERVFRYELTSDGLSVKRERLFLISNGEESALFDRVNGTSLTLHPDVAVDMWYSQRTTANHLLYLPKLLSDGLREYRDEIMLSDIMLAAYDGLTDMFVVGADTKPRPGAFYQLVQQDEFKAFLLDLLKKADLGVTDLSWVPLGNKEAELIFHQNPFREMGTRVVGISRGFYLIRQSESGISGEEFRLEHNGVHLRAESESDGTVRLIQLSPMLYQILHGGGTWFVDEVDCHLHPFMTAHLLKMFLSLPELKSQIVVTAHDTNLMTHDLWRTDEVWFAEKRLDGSTDLYSLYQFQPRHDKKLEKGYLQGLYGALPCLGGEMVDES